MISLIVMLLEFFYDKLDFNSNDLRFKYFKLYFSFWICTVKRSRKIGATTAAYPQIFFL